MKLKILTSTLMITIVTFSIGGYLLISSLFQGALSREIDASRVEAAMLRYASQVNADRQVSPERFFPSVIGQFERDDLKIRVLDDQGGVIAQSAGLEAGYSLLGMAAADKVVYTVFEHG